MATVHANKILTRFMLLFVGHNHCVKVSSDSETVREMGLWEFSGALRELMLSFDNLYIMFVFEGICPYICFISPLWVQDWFWVVDVCLILSVRP